MLDFHFCGCGTCILVFVGFVKRKSSTIERKPITVTKLEKKNVKRRINGLSIPLNISLGASLEEHCHAKLPTRYFLSLISVIVKYVSLKPVHSSIPIPETTLNILHKVSLNC